MSAWRLKEAKESCETVFDRAWSGEPQVIMRDEKPMVVVVSYLEFNRAVDGIEDIETATLFVIERLPVLMLRHKRRQCPF